MWAAASVTNICEMCQGEKIAKSVCKSCDKKICERCKESHMNSNSTKDHSILTIEEIEGDESYLCQDHIRPLAFRCRTCDDNICTKCMSTVHGRHDIIDLRDLQTEIQEHFNLVIEEKEDEIKKMAENYDALDYYEKESETNMREHLKCIDTRVKSIQLAVSQEGEKLKESFRETNKQSKRFVKECKQRLMDHNKEYRNEIQRVKQECNITPLPLLNDFVKKSSIKLKSLRPLSFSIPSIIQFSLSQTYDQEEICETVREICSFPLNSPKSGLEKINKLIFSSFKKMPNSTIFNLKNLKDIHCISCDRFGRIWVGGKTYMYKISPDFCTVLQQVHVGIWPCRFSACLNSGDAIVSFGFVSPYVVKFTSDGRRETIIDLSPQWPHDIHVTYFDNIVVDVSRCSIQIFSSNGIRIMDIPAHHDIAACVIDTVRNIIIGQKDFTNLTVLDSFSSKVIATWPVSNSGIQFLECDRHGNILAANNKEIYLFSRNGDFQKTFTVNNDFIKFICVNNDDTLFILLNGNDINKVILVKYLV